MENVIDTPATTTTALAGFVLDAAGEVVRLRGKAMKEVVKPKVAALEKILVAAQDEAQTIIASILGWVLPGGTDTLLLETPIVVGSGNAAIAAVYFDRATDRIRLAMLLKGSGKPQGLNYGNSVGLEPLLELIEAVREGEGTKPCLLSTYLTSEGWSPEQIATELGYVPKWNGIGPRA